MRAARTQVPADGRQEWRTDGAIVDHKSSAGTAAWANSQHSKLQSPDDYLVFYFRHRLNTSYILFCVSHSGTFPSCSPNICLHAGTRAGFHCWLA